MADEPVKVKIQATMQCPGCAEPATRAQVALSIGQGGTNFKCRRCGKWYLFGAWAKIDRAEIQE